MTLKQFLETRSEISSVDYTYFGKNGVVKNGFETVEAIKEGNWDIPKDILDCVVLTKSSELIDGETIAYVHLASI